MVTNNTILLMHNDTEYLLLAQKTMEAAGFYPDIAKSSTEALEKIASKPYKAMVLHHGIGDIDSLGILQQISKRGIAIPVIVLIDPGSENIIIEAIKAGAADYLVKSGDYQKILPFLVTRAIETANLKQAAKQTEEIVVESQQRLESTLSSLNEAVFIVRFSDRVIVSCNKAAESVFGYTREEMIGRNTEFLHVDKKAYENFGVDKFPALETEGIYRCEYWMRRKDGSIFPTEHTVTEILDESGNCTSVVSLVRDITARKKIEAEIKERNSQLLGLQQVSQSLIQSIELGGVAEKALETTLNVLNVDAGTIRYLDETTGELVLLAHLGLPQELFREIEANPRMKLGQGLSGNAAQQLKPLVISDLQKYPNLLYDSTYNSGFSFYVGIPLSVKGKLVGTISCFSRRQRIFTGGDLELLSSLGNMVGMSIANARLFEEQKRHSMELSSLHKVSQVVIQSLDLTTVADLTLKTTLDVMGFDAGTIRYFDRSKQELVFINTLGLPPEQERHMRSRPNIKIGEGLAGIAAKTGEPMIVKDLPKEERRFYGGAFTQGFQFAVHLPLKVKGEVVGVISSLSRKQHVLKPADLELMASIGNMVGIAIYNARLFEEQKQRAEELSALQQVSQAVSQALDLTTVASLALKATLNVMDLDAGTIRYLDKASRELVLIGHHGLPQELIQYMNSKPAIKIGEGLAGKSAQTGEIQVVEDLFLDERRFYGKAYTSDFHSSVFIPLKVKGEVVGLIGGLSRRKRAFKPAELELIASIGNMIGMAFANSRLFDQVEDAAMEWRNTFDSMNDGVAIISPDFRLLRVNQALAQMLGNTTRALIGQCCYKVFHGLDSPVENCPLARCKEEKKSNSVIRQEPYLGNRWLHIRVDPVLNTQGQLINVVHVVRDVTEEKQRQDNLEHLYRLSRALSASLDLDTVNSIALDEIAPVVGEADSTICIVLIDELSQEQIIIAAWGLYQEQLKNIRIPSPEIRQEIQDLFKEKRNVLFLDDLSKAPVMLKQLPFWNEFRSATFFPLLVRNKPIGMLITYSKNIAPLRDAQVDFLISCASAIAMAIDNARLFEQTDQALKHRVADVEAIMASMEEGLIVVDAQRKVSYYNPAAERLLGISAIEMLGQPIDIFNQLPSTRTTGLSEWLKAISRAPEEHHDQQKLYFEMWRPEHTEIETTFFSIDKAGERFGSGVLLRDITREREINRMKTEFVSLASHELRTPMTVIYGFAELLLLSKGIAGKQHGWVERIYKETKRLTNIVDDFLDITRIESGRLSIKQAAVSLKPLITQLISQLSSTYHYHSFKLDIPEDFPEPWVDAERLTQILYNLIENAAKYSPPGGMVTLSARRDEKDAWVVISVADNGFGIAEEDLLNLFSRFHRIHRPETEGIRGTGLGLYIVKSLVEMMGGRIWVESQMNKGSTFYISFPLEKTDNPPNSE